MNPLARRALLPTLTLLVATHLALPGMDGPLRLSTVNPRYFTDRSGKAIYLAGVHTWNNLVDMGTQDPPPAFNYDEFLRLLERHHLNFFRLWTWQHAVSTWNVEHHIQPLAWARTGPGLALDGKPKFDLTRPDPEYFSRLRDRVKAAADRNVYVAVMLFEGWGLQFAPEPWKGHPFNAANNINGIDGDPNHNGKGLETQTWELPAGVWELQKAYLRQVIDTVNDFDNVLYEVVNEAGPYSTLWQAQVINFVKGYEAEKPKRHPVGMTFQYEGGSNQDLFNSAADWISPNPTSGYRDDPPAADGRKVIVNDTDHLWGIGGNRAWIWKSFCRGLNLLFMDPQDDLPFSGQIYRSGRVVKHTLKPEELDPLRAALGLTRQLAEQLPLEHMRPRPEMANTGFCLATERGSKGPPAVVVYAPPNTSVTVELDYPDTTFQSVWLDPDTGARQEHAIIPGLGSIGLAAPFRGDAVLLLLERH